MPGLKSAFQLILKSFTRVQVWILCRPVKFFTPDIPDCSELHFVLRQGFPNESLWVDELDWINNGIASWDYQRLWFILIILQSDFIMCRDFIVHLGMWHLKDLLFIIIIIIEYSQPWREVWLWHGASGLPTYKLHCSEEFSWWNLLLSIHWLCLYTENK